MATDLPRVLADTTTLGSATDLDADAGGAVWRLEPAARQLGGNVIRLRADGQIAAHLGPDLDVLLHVLAGSGQVVTPTDPIHVQAWALVWLPRRSQRAILAGPDGAHLPLAPPTPARPKHCHPRHRHCRRQPAKGAHVHRSARTSGLRRRAPGGTTAMTRDI